MIWCGMFVSCCVMCCLLLCCYTLVYLVMLCVVRGVDWVAVRGSVLYCESFGCVCLCCMCVRCVALLFCFALLSCVVCVYEVVWLCVFFFFVSCCVVLVSGWFGVFHVLFCVFRVD